MTLRNVTMTLFGLCLLVLGVGLSVLFMGCSAETDLPVGDEPQAGSVAVDVGLVTQDLDVGVLACPLEQNHVDLDGWSVPPRLPSNTPGVARPAGEKLLSKPGPNGCVGCPLVWVYFYGTAAGKKEVMDAAYMWNQAAGWYVVGVADRAPERKNVPTYGVIVNMDESYKEPPIKNGAKIVGVNAKNWYRNNRDGIFINKTVFTVSQRKQIIAHELGHTLIQTGGAWHSGLPFSLMHDYWQPNQYIPADIKLYLNTLKNQVLNGTKTLPCALRGICN